MADIYPRDWQKFQINTIPKYVLPICQKGTKSLCWENQYDEWITTVLGPTVPISLSETVLIANLNHSPTKLMAHCP